MAAMSGLPWVSVPVLSSTTVSICPACSIAAAFLNHTPCRTATPMPAMMAAGVAKPSAQGQATTSTATACTRALVALPVNSHVAIKVSAAMDKTVGTNTAAALSASRAMGALLPCASASAFIMSPSSVLLPNCSAR